MLRVTLEQWRMFQAVVKYGGFNQAAQGIHKSQSSIHSAVHKIERNLGVQLFKIEGRKTRVTEAGELMLQRANYLLDEATKVESIGQTLGEGTESLLKIAVDEVFPQSLLYKVLSATSKQYPMLRIELMESILTGAKELLANTQADIAISPFTLEDGYNEELCQIKFIAVAHPSHELHAIERDLTLEDLKSHRQIVVRDSALATRQDVGWLGADQRWTVSHMHTSINMIASGLGFAWLPVDSINIMIQEGTLKPLKLKHNAQRSSKFHLIFKDGDRLGPAARTFIDKLRYQCMNHQ